MNERWEYEQLFFSSDDYFAEIFRQIEQAQATIDVETYIFTTDLFARKVEAALARAAQRGVRVRLVVDGIGSYAWLGRWTPELIASGVHVRIFHPVQFMKRFFNRTPHWRRLGPLNRRTHRKMWIFDQKKAFIGSQNITDVHLNERWGPNAWRDTAIAVQGEQVQFLNLAFENVWLRSCTTTGERVWRASWKINKSTVPSLVRLNFAARLRRKMWHDLRHRLRQAQKRIWITNAYFVPSPAFMAAVLRARRRGVDVQFMFPMHSDVPFMSWVARSFYGRLIKGGIRVFEYEMRFLHAKSVLIDDWSTVGSSNLNTRSFQHDLEVDLVVSQPENIQKMAEQFKKDLNSCVEVTSTILNESWISIWTGRTMALLLRYWI